MVDSISNIYTHLQFVFTLLLFLFPVTCIFSLSSESSRSRAATREEGERGGARSYEENCWTAGIMPEWRFDQLLSHLILHLFCHKDNRAIEKNKQLSCSSILQPKPLSLSSSEGAAPRSLAPGAGEGESSRLGLTLWDVPRRLCLAV